MMNVLLFALCVLWLIQACNAPFELKSTVRGGEVSIFEIKPQG